MEKLNEYLQTLVSTRGYELHLEPNKTPYVISASGMSEVTNTPLQGTQISMMIFPLIPNEVKQQLPNQPEIEFVHPHNLGRFNFLVKKSPAGFNVTVRPVLLKSAAPDAPATNNVNNPRHTSVPPQVSSSLSSAVSVPTTPIVNNLTNNQKFSFESASALRQSSVEDSPAVKSHIPDLIIEDRSAIKANDSYTNQQKVEIVEVNDPEFITTFSDTSTYEEPGKGSDYKPYQTPNYDDLIKDYDSNQAETVQPEPIQADPSIMPQEQFYQAPVNNFPLSQQSPVQAASVQAPAQMKERMDSLFKKMADFGASDLHLSVSMAPMVRKDGKMMELEEGQAKLTPEMMKHLLTSIMPEKNQEEFERRHDTDFAYEIIGLARFRANVFMDRKGMGGVFRIIPSKILTAEQLNLSKAIMDLCSLSKGLVVVTGPTGSGKSTTLCAMVDSINKTREDHIITIEDPIEFTHENQKCLVNQREVHNHTDSFKDALRAALREDPDILLVGEMRDLETISIAIETAETGHLVFGTLHTTTAASTIDRIIDQFPADRQQQIRVMLSESLKGVIAQTLLPKKGGGRVAALEVLIVSPAISNLIREGKTFQIPSAMQTGKAQGMVMLNDALFAHVQKGLVEPRDAYIKAVDKTGFEQMLTRGGFKL